MWIFLTNHLKTNLSNLFMNWTSCVCFSIQQKDIWRDTKILFTELIPLYLPKFHPRRFEIVDAFFNKWKWNKFQRVNKRYFKLHMISFSTVTMYLNFYVQQLSTVLTLWLRKIQTVVHYATELNSPANLRAKIIFRE